MTKPARAAGTPADEDHDVVGWDGARPPAGGGGAAWRSAHAEGEPSDSDQPGELGRQGKKRRRGLRWWHWVALATGLLLLLGLAAVVLAPGETYAWQNTPHGAVDLMAVAQAQKLYYQQNGCYAARARDLDNHGVVLGPEMIHAFHDLHDNGDPLQAQPFNGFLFHMLQGDAGHPTAFYKSPGNFTAGMTHWAATARTSVPNETGYLQFFITEDGKIYAHEEPAAGDPQYSTFLLDALPDAFNADGSVDLQKLGALGWGAYK